jgi:hypothetical protein
MKKFIQILVLTLGAALFFAACAPVYDPAAPEDYDLRAEKALEQTERGTFVPRNFSVIASADRLQVQPATGGVPQNITLTTSPAGFNIDIDPTSKKIPGFEIFALSDAPAANQPYTQGASLNYAAYSTSKDTVELRLDFNTGITTGGLMIKIDARTATFNGGTGKLNLNGNAIPGELDDSFVQNLIVEIRDEAGTGILPLPVGVGIIPRNTLLPVPRFAEGRSTLSTGTSTLIFDRFDDQSGRDNDTRITNFSSSIAGAFEFQKFTGTGWTSVSPSESYFDRNIQNENSKGTLALVFTTAQFDLFRYRINKSKLETAEPVPGGYTLKGSYKDVEYTDWNYDIPIPAFVYNATAPDSQLFPPNAEASDVYGAFPTYSITVNVMFSESSITEINIKSLDAANIKIFQKDGNGKEVYEITGFSLRPHATNPELFVIDLPDSYAKLADGSLELRLYGVEIGYTIPSQVDGASLSKTTRFVGADETGGYRVNVVYGAEGSGPPAAPIPTNPVPAYGDFDFTALRYYDYYGG